MVDYIKFADVSKEYHGSSTKVIKNFSLNVKKKEFITILGPSGSGKTTLIRLLAGLEEITEGKIYLEKKVINDIHPKNRDVAMVFQNYALYPHFNVFENIAFSLKIKKIKKSVIEKKVTDAAKLLEISDILTKKPKQLSGGQRQRVALARALVRNPKVFVLDEPLSNLDTGLRTSIRRVISNLHKTIEATMIYITHDQMEAMTMADRIVVIKDGEIQQISSPKELYQRPKNLFVANFIGTPKMNIFDLADLPTKIYQSYQEIIELEDINNVVVGVRPHDVILDELGMEVEILLIEYLGDCYHLVMEYHQKKMQMTAVADRNFFVGQKIKIKFQKLHFFKKDRETRIEK